MTKDEFHDLHVKKALDGLQFLDEMGGPSEAEGYVLVMMDVVKELENRIQVAKIKIASERK